jgi:mutator protein MutT
MSYVVTSDIHGNEYQVSLDELKWRPSVYGIVVNDGKILLTKQYGKFEVPGGGVDLGETPEQAVIREIKEETGIEVTGPRLVKHLSSFFSHEEQGGVQHSQSLLLFFVCEYIGGEFSLDGLMEDEKPVTEMAEWIPLSNLDDVDAGSTFDWKSIVKEVMGL